MAAAASMQAAVMAAAAGAGVVAAGAGQQQCSGGSGRVCSPLRKVNALVVSVGEKDARLLHAAELGSETDDMFRLSGVGSCI